MSWYERHFHAFLAVTKAFIAYLPIVALVALTYGMFGVIIGFVTVWVKKHCK